MARGDRLLLAYSGGADSTALLVGLLGLSGEWGLTISAAHLDHGLDGDSGRRAAEAGRIAGRLGVELREGRVSVDDERRPGESPEAAARRVRYGFLESQRAEAGARWILTAHHRDDQVETVLLRILFGSGIEGLAGIRPVHRNVLRPLLACSRRDLAAEAEPFQPVVDPGNWDLDRPRNRVRHALVPSLRETDPALEAGLLRLSAAATGARRSLGSRLEPVLDVRRDPWGLTVSRAALSGLPEPLWRHALSLCHRLGGLPLPPSRAQERDLRRQCRAPGRVGCDILGSSRWESDGDRVRLLAEVSPKPRFAYTLPVPGEVDIPEIGVRFRLRRGVRSSWMFAPSPSRAGLSLPLEDGDRVFVRNRRPGDRIRPFGCAHERRLKDLLIDRRVPRPSRDRLPLLLVEEQLAWIPGVTVAEGCRITDRREVWIAEIESLEPETRQAFCK